MNIFRRISRAVRGSDKDDREKGWEAEPKPFFAPIPPLPLPPPPPQPGAWPAPQPFPPPRPASPGWGTPGPDGWGASTTMACVHDHSEVSSKDHHAHCAEIWDRCTSRWVVFDPKDIPPVRVTPAQHDTHTYFCVTSRYNDYWSEPYQILTHFTKPLHSFVTSTCYSYGTWSESGAQPNELEIGQALRTLKKSKKKLDEITETTSKSSTKSVEDKLELVKSLGNIAVDNRTPEPELHEYLKDVEKQLKVFVAYLEEKYKPIAERLASAIRYGYMEFDLLPFYFEPGQEVWYTPFPYNEPMAMKVSQVHVNGDSVFTRGAANCGDIGAISVEGHGYSWNGRSFGVVPLKETCFKFTGRKEISKLPVQLMTADKRDELTARGRRYKAEAGIRYRTYKGERVMIDRLGYQDAQNYDFNHGDAVDGNTKPKRRKNMKVRRCTSYDSFRPPVAPPSPLPLGAWQPSLEAISGEDIADDMLCFLPTELFGYNLVKKEWQSFELDGVRPVEFDSKAWDHLVLDADVKTLIKGLVEVSTKDMAATGAIVDDVIARKGGGLTSVLYGPPGTGKTLTAEAVAELLRRPLLNIGSSDLPRDPSGMEDTMRYLLRLATTWDAVMLIDEADVFLEKRSLHEIERNALVSVALRVLEYHRGVVFLTTNRIKVFDEAFHSRFSIAVKYPELNKTGRYAIWSRFLEMAGYKIVSSPFVTNDDLGDKLIPRQSIEELAGKNFNGRTIKNLVRTAQSLALSMNSPLKMEHIHIVVRAQEKFLEDFAAERISSD